MSDQKPKWPNSLPPLSHVVFHGKLVRLTPADLTEESERKFLSEAMYWHPEDNYYLFWRDRDGSPVTLIEQLKALGVEIKTIDRDCYVHPHPSADNDFVHMPPDEIRHAWHRQMAETEMYVRGTLSLANWAIKSMDFSYAAYVAASKSEDIVEAKPGLYGFSINLKALFRRLKRFKNS